MNHFREQEGFSLIAALVGASLSAMAIVFGLKIAVSSLQSYTNIENKFDLMTLRNFVRLQIDCAKTMDGARITGDNIRTKCESTTAANQATSDRLQLFKKNQFGQSTLLGEWMERGISPRDPRYRTNKIGDWYLRTTCSLEEQTFIIRAAKIGPRGKSINGRVVYDFYDNPLRHGEKLDFSAGDPKKNFIASALISGVAFPACNLIPNNRNLDLREAVLVRDVNNPLYSDHPKLFVIDDGKYRELSVSDPNLPFELMYRDEARPYTIPEIYFRPDIVARSQGYVSVFNDAPNYWDKIRAVRCNTRKGWKLVYCNSGQHGFADSAFIPDGCMTNDFDDRSVGGAKHTELRIICQLEKN